MKKIIYLFMLLIGSFIFQISGYSINPQPEPPAPAFKPQKINVLYKFQVFITFTIQGSSKPKSETFLVNAFNEQQAKDFAIKQAKAKNYKNIIISGVQKIGKA